MKASIRILGIVVALLLLAGVMAYLAGFFEEKIPVDFSAVAPTDDSGLLVDVKAETRPLIEQAAGTLLPEMRHRILSEPECRLENDRGGVFQGIDGNNRGVRVKLREPF